MPQVRQRADQGGAARIHHVQAPRSSTSSISRLPMRRGPERRRAPTSRPAVRDGRGKHPPQAQGHALCSVADGAVAAESGSCVFPEGGGAHANGVCCRRFKAKASPKRLDKRHSCHQNNTFECSPAPPWHRVRAGPSAGKSEEPAPRRCAGRSPTARGCRFPSRRIGVAGGRTRRQSSSFAALGDDAKMKALGVVQRPGFERTIDVFRAEEKRRQVSHGLLDVPSGSRRIDGVGVQHHRPATAALGQPGGMCRPPRSRPRHDPLANRPCHARSAPRRARRQPRAPPGIDDLPRAAIIQTWPTGVRSGSRRGCGWWASGDGSGGCMAGMRALQRA